MRRRILFLAPLAFLGVTVAAQAADLTFNVTNGTLSPSGSFTGSFQINSTSEFIDGGSFLVTFPTGGTLYTFNSAPSQTTVPGLATFNDTKGDLFRLAINGSITTLSLNTLASNGPGADTALFLAVGGEFGATGATIAPAATPEPSSLALLGTGALGLLGAARRRFAA